MTERAHAHDGPPLVSLLAPLERRTSFVRDGRVCFLREPDDLATMRQLYRLNAIGALAVVEPGQVEPLTKGEAAYAIDATGEAA